MYQGTLQTIESSADFLTSFLALPRTVQDLILPHLDQPQRMALKVLHSCGKEAQPTTAIAQYAQIHAESVRQILVILERKGLIISRSVGPAKHWQLV